MTDVDPDLLRRRGGELRARVTFRRCTSLLLGLLLMSRTAFGGAEPNFSSKYPHLSSISSFGPSVWFAGDWKARLLVVEYDSLERWLTYVSPFPSFIYHTVRQDREALLFLGDGNAVRFDCSSRTWSMQDTGLSPPSESPKAPVFAYERFNQGILVKDGAGKHQYLFPLPSFNAYRRWRSDPRPDYELNSIVGTLVQRDSTLWFDINFYAGEGSTGIGGLGMFDLATRKFGVLRHRFLAGSSLNHLPLHDDWLFVGTGVHGELEDYGDVGLVIVDFARGRIADLNEKNSPLLGSMFDDIKVVKGRLWLLTDGAIVGWNITSNAWCAARMDSVVLKDSTVLYRRIHTLARTNDLGSFACDSLIAVTAASGRQRVSLRWAEQQFAHLRSGEFTVAEVGAPTGTRGWVERKEFEQFRRLPSDFIAGGPGMVVFQDSGLTVPYDHVMFSSLKALMYSAKAVLVDVRGSWCVASDVSPEFNELFHDRVFAPVWDSLDGGTPLRDRAIREFTREQSEIRDSIPVYDTTLVITKGMDLYSQFEDMMYARWLPSGHGEDPAPNGIQVDFHTREGDIAVQLTRDAGGLTLNGSPYQSGSEWTTATRSMKACLTFRTITYSGANHDILVKLTLHYKLWIFPIADDSSND